MAHILQPSPFWDEMEDEHRSWLAAFDPQYLRNWEKMRNGNREAGLCEAAVRRLLQKHLLTVEPNFLKEKGITFPNVVDSSDQAQKTFIDQYQSVSGLSAVPLSYLIDREGKIVEGWYEFKRGEDRVEPCSRGSESSRFEPRDGLFFRENQEFQKKMEEPGHFVHYYT